MDNTILGILASTYVPVVPKTNTTHAARDFEKVLEHKVEKVQNVSRTFMIKREHPEETNIDKEETKTDKRAANAKLGSNTRVMDELILSGKVEKEEPVINNVSFRKAYFMD